jgi:hypothetical protein
MFKTDQRTATLSRISLPTYGRAFGMTERVRVDSIMCGTTVRGIARTHVTGTVAVLTQGAFPGTSAWRPPIC